MKNTIPTLSIFMLSLSACVIGEPKEPANTIIAQSGHENKYYADLMINGNEINCMVDTGAIGISISRKQADSIDIKYEPDIAIWGKNNKIVGRDSIILNQVVMGHSIQNNVSGSILENWDGCLVGSLFLKRAFDYVWITDGKMWFIDGAKPSTDDKDYTKLTINRAFKLGGRWYDGSGTIQGYESRFYTRVFINGKPLVCIVDTGAHEFIIDVRQAKMVGIKNSELSYNKTVISTSGKTGAAEQSANIIWGDFIDDDFPIIVLNTNKETCLIGMPYLDTFDHIIIEKNKMTFKRLKTTP